MLLALSLGFAGSWGHCVGMCSGVIMLINRNHALQDKKFAWVQIHFGRIISYSILGLLAGFLGGLTEYIFDVLPNMKVYQGWVAIFASIIGLIFSLSLLGWVPSPEIYLSKLVKIWGNTFRRVTNPNHNEERNKAPTPFLIGLLWGLLPCGLVFTAIFTAIVSTNPIDGLLRMFTFGLATLPALISVQWFTKRKWALNMPRYLAALVLVVFSLQLSMRGMASLGLVEHYMINGVMLW